MWHFFIKGGIVMVPLTLCSITGLVIIIERLLFYSRGFEPDQREFNILKQFLGQGRITEAKQLTSRWNCPLGRIISASIKQKESNPSLIENAAQSAGELELKQLQRGLNILDTIVTASPLLGLLGTVTGIIRSFLALSVSGGTQATQLSAGIAEALYTTAFGLAIAIPALFFVNAFYGIVEHRARELTCKSQAILTILKESKEG